MKHIITLNIVLSSSPFEKRVEMYIYDEDRFIEKALEGVGESSKTKYEAEEKYTWHFSNDEKVEKFLECELAGYYGKMTLQSLSGYLVRYLNYKHTGISIRSFSKEMVYIGKDGGEYICLEGGAVHDSKWIQTSEIKGYFLGREKNFKMPQGIGFCVLGWLELETELVNITGRAEMQEYRIEGNWVLFL